MASGGISSVRPRFLNRTNPMKKLLYSCLILVSTFALGQEQLQSINATAASVDIRDGKDFRKKAWTISPEISPDEYTTSSANVTFYTDRDSIKIDVKRDKPTDFIINFNGKKALTRITFVPSYLDKLKSAARYDLSDHSEFPEFTYQSASDPTLVKIRVDFKLDSIAGTGNATSRILNLMHFVHNTVRHDGSSSNPVKRNAADLISVCKSEKRGVNCRMMAIVLNDFYLAMGFKSKFVTCMPKEEKFDDCHVINSVWNPDTKNWIWIDPTFDAYVMDETGQLLGIAEVRQRLVNGMPLLLNPEANWNRQITQTASDYLYRYMAKNLYRLQTPIRSQSDLETWTAGQKAEYVELLPVDGVWKKVPEKGVRNEQSKVDFTYYQTNNPDLFWR